MTETDVDHIERAALDILTNHKTDSQYLAIVGHFLAQACQLETTDFRLKLRMLQLRNRFEAYLLRLEHADEPRLADVLQAPQLNNPHTQHLLATLATCTVPPAPPPPPPPALHTIGYRAPFIGSPTTRYLLSLLRQRSSHGE